MERTRSIAMWAVIACVWLGGCESSRDRDREAVREEMRKRDELFRSLAPPISVRDAVGCHVCPGLCQYEDLGEQLSMTALMERYRRIAIAHPDHPKTNRKLLRLACIAARKGVPAELEFIELLYDDADVVRYYAALHALALAFAVTEPLEALTEIGNASAADYAYTARMRVWIYYELELKDRWPTERLRYERLQRPHVW